MTVSVDSEVKDKLYKILKKREIKISKFVEDYFKEVIKSEEVKNNVWKKEI